MNISSPGGGVVRKGELQWAGFWLAGLLCLVFMVVKLASAFPWSWWRVLLPLWVVLWHDALYLAVGFIWSTWIICGRKGDDLRVRRHRQLDRYQFGSMARTLIFMDNVLRKMGARGNPFGGGWRRADRMSSYCRPDRCWPASFCPGQAS